MGNNRIKRSVSVLISMLLVFAQIISVAGCKGKDEDGVKRVSRDSTWFNAKVTGLDGKYKNKKMDSFYCDFLGEIKNGDYVVQRAMAVNKNNDSISLWKRTVKVTFMSDGGMLYVTDISEIVAKEMPLDKPGLLIRVNRNRPPVIYDECRFIYI